ncbi:LysR substrate-binding domain-containing protein [Gordonia sp. CPCC 205515]|uniref:LysR family transcriptional regulator n=1 Tax=Gordonia sp. CPCC 205515 TaxID=3140791 RepID=UPI003AF3E891
MEIHQITAFLAVADELHFGRAAQRLRVAQPPLSRTIKQLEKELGAELFVRSTRRVQLTEAGAALVGPAQRILDDCRLAELAVATSGRGRTGRVRVGFAGSSSHQLVATWARLVRRTHPGIELVLDSSAYAAEALNKLLDGTYDIALARWMFDPPAITSRVIAHEQIVIGLPRAHRLADDDAVAMGDLADERWVTLPADPGSVTRDLLVRFAYEAGFVPRIVQSAPDSFSLTALVAAEVGATLTVSSVAGNITNDDVVFLPLRDAPVLDVRLAWREDNESPATHEVLRLSEEALPSVPPTD